METNQEKTSLLVTALQAAVPLWYLDLGLPASLPSYLKPEVLEPIQEAIAHHGDILLFGGGKPGETADVFNKFAKAMAILSCFPGGFDLFGRHWEHGGDTDIL
jgi:hypothetical protein